MIEGTRQGDSRAYWACQLTGWGLYAAAQTFNATALLGLPLARAAAQLVFLHALGLGLTHLLRAFMLRRGWSTLGVRALIPRSILASVALGLPVALLMMTMDVAQLWGPEYLEATTGQNLPGWMHPLLLGTLNWSVLFLFWIGFYFTFTSLRERRDAQLRQSELVRALQASELRLLKSQLNPHFLFNCLNTVRALIAHDPAGAQKAVTQLARTLRYTLSSGQDDLVTLERELEMVEDYLALESLRFGERLKIERAIEARATNTRIPVMLLQTVVENAIKHGIATLPQGGVLRIAARREQEALVIEVHNPCPAVPPAPTVPGIGLPNTIERMRLLFGARAQFDLDLSRTGQALATIRIPCGA